MEDIYKNQRIANEIKMKEDKEIEEYLDKIRDVLTGMRGGARCSSGPCELSEHVYIGGKNDARSPTLLKCYGITHVLNCAAEPNYEVGFDESPYSKNTGLHYCAFEARDNDEYPILMHFLKAKEFIDGAKVNGGKVLVHCEMGINRSAAICVAYILVDEKLTLLEVIKRVKRQRRVILLNEGFQKRLVEFARDRNLLFKANSE